MTSTESNRRAPSLTINRLGWLLEVYESDTISKMTMSVKHVWTAALIFSVTLAVGGCHEKGPAEKAGEKLDKAGEKISDTLDPKGPAEKAGRKIDKALHD